MTRKLSYSALEKLGRVRLSPNYFFRDFLYSEISNYHGIPNIPHHPDVAVEAATKFCEQLLEPLTAAFGKISIRSAYRSPEVNQFGNENGLNCASNQANYGAHIFDYPHPETGLGATCTLVVNSWVEEFEKTKNWPAMAWFIHDHLPYSHMWFYPQLGAFNLTWSETPQRIIKSYVTPKGTLTKPGMDNHDTDHSTEYDTPYFRAAGERLKAYLAVRS
ncbi:peptidase M15 [Hyphobacterium sp.]|uniref:peptidase M15 n=1 Tax=Hyphobacterium sp. TaxID=2004662 RepID=UPI003BAA625B